MPLGLWIWYFGSLAPLQWSLLVYFLSSLHWKIKGCMWVRTIYESVPVSFRQPQKVWRMFSLKTWNCCPHKKLLHPGVVGEYQWDRPLQSDHVLPATPCSCSQCYLCSATQPSTPLSCDPVCRAVVQQSSQWCVGSMWMVSDRTHTCPLRPARQTVQILPN